MDHVVRIFEEFDTKLIEHTPVICKELIPKIVADAAAGITVEPAIPGADIFSIYVHRLIVAAHAATYYKSIGRAMIPKNMHHSDVLAPLKIEWDTYKDLKK